MGSAEAEPEAKADPYLLYGGYYGHGLGYGYGYGYPYATMATTERGVLRPSLRPRPIPTFCMADTTDMVSATATAMDTPTDTDTTARGVLMLILLLLPPLSDTHMPSLTPPPLSPLLLEATRPLPVIAVS